MKICIDCLRLSKHVHGNSLAGLLRNGAYIQLLTETATGTLVTQVQGRTAAIFSRGPAGPLASFDNASLRIQAHYIPHVDLGSVHEASHLLKMQASQPVRAAFDKEGLPLLSGFKEEHAQRGSLSSLGGP